MSERHHDTPEHSKSPEHSAELAEAAGEALKRIEHTAEVVGENAAEKLVAAREAIEKQAEAPVPTAEKEATKKHHPTRLDKKSSYWQTVHAMQRRLKPASREFSKFIHNPSVEQASDVVGKTVLRPSVALGATSTALIVGAFFYFTARQYGFLLSGSEFIVSMLVGGILGTILEFSFKAIRSKK